MNGFHIREEKVGPVCSVRRMISVDLDIAFDRYIFSVVSRVADTDTAAAVRTGTIAGVIGNHAISQNKVTAKNFDTAAHCRSSISTDRRTSDLSRAANIVCYAVDC